MINSLELNNFKCFEHISLKLRPMTILAGLNGMGKSTILQSILLLRQSYQQGLLKETGLALNGSLIKLGKAEDVLYEDADEERISIGIFLKNGKNGKWQFKYDSESDVIALDKCECSDDIYDTNLFSDSFQYLEAERIGPRTSYEMSDYSVRQHYELGSRGQFTAHFLSEHGSTINVKKAIMHSKNKSSLLRLQVEAWLNEICPGTQIKSTSHKGMDLVQLVYSFMMGNHVTKEFRPTNVGFGITYTLPILVAILASKPNSIILIENPEAHLHPKGQIRLGNLMAKAAEAGTQIIIETHSDHILNGIRLSIHDKFLSKDNTQIHFFEREKIDDQIKSKVVSPSVDSDGRIDYWPEGFFDEWDKSLKELLSPKD